MMTAADELRYLMERPGVAQVPPDYDPDKPLWEYDKRIINPFVKVKPVQSFCRMGIRKALPLQGIVTLSGKPKQGKSTAVRALLLPLLTEQPFDTIAPEIRPRRVLVFDMEMDEATLQERITPMVEQLGGTPTRYYVSSLLLEEPRKRMDEIEEMVALYIPDIVVIDPVTMLVKNINDPQEAQAMKDRLLRLSASRALWIVIHQNKSPENNQMKGHIGSMMEEAAVENYSVSRKGGAFTITPVSARRSLVDDDSARVNFAVSEQGYIISAAGEIMKNRERERDGNIPKLEEIFSGDESLRRCEIVARIRATDSTITEDAAQKQVTRFISCGALVKVGEKRGAPFKINYGENWTSAENPDADLSPKKCPDM